MLPLKSIVSGNVFLHVPWATRPAQPDGEANLGGFHEAGGRYSERDGDHQGSETPSTRWGEAHGSKTSVKAKSTSKLKLVFFVTGNPGLIAYYHPFLSLLVRDLQEKGREDVVVAGMSLLGFEVEDNGDSRADKKGGEEKHPSPGSDYDLNDAHDDDAQEEEEDQDEGRLLYPPVFGQAIGTEKLPTLQQQIELSYTRLDSLVGRVWRDTKDLFDERDDEPVEVVLMGHSVGAYICFELVRLWHERHPCESMPPRHTTEADSRADTHASNSASTPLLSQEIAWSKPLWTPSTCILLTPTIHDIHLSPSGRIATPLLTYLSFLPSLAHMLVHAVLLRSLPAAWLAGLVSRVTGMQPDSHGLKATLAFLKSERGVRQALYMASLEMKEIREDRWGEEVWGASHTKTLVREGGGIQTSSPGLFFWFAEEDHWVADATKVAILKSRASGHIIERNGFDKVVERQDVGETDEVQIKGRQQSEGGVPQRPNVRLFETKGLAHAWCLDQSEFVARRVSKWLREVWDEKE